MIPCSEKWDTWDRGLCHSNFSIDMLVFWNEFGNHLPRIAGCIDSFEDWK